MSSVASKPGECSAVYSSLSDDTLPTPTRPDITITVGIKHQVTYLPPPSFMMEWGAHSSPMVSYLLRTHSPRKSMSVQWHG